jgi:spore germination protein KA
MSIWSKLKSLLTIDDYTLDKTFSLGDRPPYSEHSEQEDTHSVDTDPENQGGNKSPLKPMKTSSLKKKKGDRSPVDPHSDEIYASLEDNLKKLKARFHMPPNIDVVIREFTIPLDPPVKAAIAFMEGLASRDTINNHILLPLMLLSNLDEQRHNMDSVQVILDRLLPGNQVEYKHSFRELIDGITSGSTLVLLDAYPSGSLIETKGWEHRTVSQPIAENVVRGPQEGFVEHIRVNTALVRKRLRCDTLVTDMLKVGRLSGVDCALLYIEGLTNPKLVQEVRRRVKSIDTDYITDSGTLEQFIEDNPLSLIPGQMTTERPDRVAAALTEGHVAIIVDGDPFALIMPITFWSLLHTAEDSYIRWPYSYALRTLRILALFINLLLPAFYIAIVNYHPEMIPTDLMLAVAAARETIPFPAILEVVLMEVSFDLIREAGVRIPSIIGPTIGIVGALVLGQAAVAANIVSPLLVIIVALTGLGSFAIPNYGLIPPMRTFRFVFLLLAAFLGFYGLAVGIFMTIIHICGQKSFGVPTMSPISPFRPPSGDVVYRQPIWKQELRPLFMRPLFRRRQPAITRPWDPNTAQLKTKEQNGKTREAQEDTKGGKSDGNN